MRTTSPLPRNCCTILLRLVEDADGSRIVYASSGSTLDEEPAHIRAVKELCASAAAGDQLCELEDGFWRGYGLLPRDKRRKIEKYFWYHHMHPPIHG